MTNRLLLGEDGGDAQGESEENRVLEGNHCAREQWQQLGDKGGQRIEKGENLYEVRSMRRVELIQKVIVRTWPFN
jgi:hypothetical protein